ncbi:MAG: hypothetical protein ACE37K_17785 [Planctomycetota bacterium]
MNVPALGSLVGIALMSLATLQSPGGYHWADQTISALLAPTAASGQPNPARPLAVAGAFVVLASVGLLFHRLSTRAVGWCRSTIRIGGIGAMVYAALTVTPMHDLMVSIALLFYLAALFATLHLLRRERQRGAFWAGVVALVAKLGSAVLYYGDVGVDLLPLTQKLTLGWTLGWLLTAQREAPPRNGAG